MSHYLNQRDTALEVERRLVLLSHLFHRLKAPGACALIADGAGNLAELFARSVGLRVLRYASRSLIEHYGDWVEPWLNPGELTQALVAPEQQTACLGAADGWLQYLYPVSPGLPQSPPPDIRLRIESLDRVIAHCLNPVVIALNDAAAVEALNLCTESCLLQHKPVLMLTLDAVPVSASRQLLLELHRLGYKLLDGRLDPLTTEDLSEYAVPAQCIALHPDRITLDPKLLELLNTGSPVTLAAVQVRNSKVRPYIESSGFTFDALESGELLIPIGQAAAHNWYDAEYGDNDSWRWSGPGRVARLLLPCPSEGDYWLSLHFHGIADNAMANEMRFFVNGALQPVVFDQTQLGQRLYLPFSVNGRSQYPGWIELVIALPQTLRPNPEDPRKLGVSIDNICLRWRDPS